MSGGGPLNGGQTNELSPPVHMLHDGHNHSPSYVIVGKQCFSKTMGRSNSGSRSKYSTRFPCHIACETNNNLCTVHTLSRCLSAHNNDMEGACTNKSESPPTLTSSRCPCRACPAPGGWPAASEQLQSGLRPNLQMKCGWNDVPQSVDGKRHPKMWTEGRMDPNPRQRRRSASPCLPTSGKMRPATFSPAHN